MGPGAYVNSRHTYSVAAITTVHACFISFEIFKHLVKTNGDFAESLLEDISEKSLGSHNQDGQPVAEENVRKTCRCSSYFSDEVFNSDEYEMILSRQELGEMTNMAKECVVRILKELEDSGVIYSDSSAKLKYLTGKNLFRFQKKDRIRSLNSDQSKYDINYQIII